MCRKHNAQIRVFGIRVPFYMPDAACGIPPSTACVEVAAKRMYRFVVLIVHTESVHCV